MRNRAVQLWRGLTNTRCAHSRATPELQPLPSRRIGNSETVRVQTVHQWKGLMGLQNSRLTPAELASLRSITNFSVDEIRQCYTDFLQECPSGDMSKEQFRRMYSQFYPGGNPTRFTEHVFRTFDTDGNGKIDFREFLCGMCVMSKGDAEQKLKWAFTMYDINGDGYITREEMVDILTAIYKMIGSDQKAAVMVSTPEQCTELVFAVMDKNNDGKLSLDEFIEGATEYPDILPSVLY